MKRLLEFGRKAFFYVRVLSGYEERRIRSYRLQLEQRLRSAQEKKQAIKKIPEQVILSEVRRMVEEMQNLNKKLEDMEGDINEYFKPIDKEVGTIINLQMEKEKGTTEMMGAVYKQAMLEKDTTETAEQVKNGNNANMEMMSAILESDHLDKKTGSETKDTQNQTNPSTTRHS